MPIAQSYNFQTQGKWIMVVPWNLIDDQIKDSNFSLNLYNFQPPTFSVGSTEMSVMGHRIPIPTNVMTDSKNIQMSYIVSSDLSQYIFLYNWWRHMVTAQGTGFSLKNQPTADIRVYFLNEFKERTVVMIFKRCWIQEVGSLTMDMQAGEQVVLGNFQLNYFSAELDSVSNNISLQTKNDEIYDKENPR